MSFRVIIADSASGLDDKQLAAASASLPAIVAPSAAVEELEMSVLRTSRSGMEDKHAVAAGAAAAADAGAGDAADEGRLRKKRPMTAEAKAKRKLKRKEKHLEKLRATGA